MLLFAEGASDSGSSAARGRKASRRGDARTFELGTRIILLGSAFRKRSGHNSHPTLRANAILSGFVARIEQQVEWSLELGFQPTG